MSDRDRRGTTHPNAPASIVSQPRLALHFVYPPELAGMCIDLFQNVELGREATPGQEGRFAAVPHGTISRRHATIRLGFGVPIISDLKSSNGTRVNGVAIDIPTTLRPQSVVRLGDAIAVVDAQRVVPFEDDVSPPGTSPAIAALREVLRRAATDTAPVCIIGETGTGKEALAADIHRLSGRSGPYVKLNCAELSPQLIESQLFGHERGAFTGATASHQGLFMAADKGTLFLDEIGEIPLELQAKLLRVIQEGEVRPVGSVQTRRTDARLVCATNRDLAKQVEDGAFRRDLFARLSFFELQLPPVSQRRQDILRWIDLLARRWGAQRNEPCAISLQPVVAEHLLLHSWPDNLRGLDRFVHRVLSMTDGKVGLRALAECLPEIEGAAKPSLDGSEPPPEPQADRSMTTDRPAQDRPTKEEFLAVYEATGRSVRATSKHFGKDRRQVYRWLEAFGIER